MFFETNFLIQDYYPEMLATKFFVNIPGFFQGMFSAFSPFISEATKKKFIVCAKGSVREKMLQVIDVDCLPQEYLYEILLFTFSLLFLITSRYGGLGKNFQATSSVDSSSTSKSTPLPSTNTAAEEKAVEVDIERRGKHEVTKNIKKGDEVCWEFTTPTYVLNIR